MPKTDSGKILFNKCLDIVNKSGNSRIKSVKYESKDVSYYDFMGINKKPKTQMIIETVDNKKIRVMTRFLDVAGGSVTEKLPYFMESAKLSMKEDEIIFIFDGQGYTPQILNYLNTSALNYNNIRICDVSTFENWIRNIL